MNSGSKSPTTSFGFNPLDDLNDLRMSEAAVPLHAHVRRFVSEVVEPMSVAYFKLDEKKDDPWTFAPGQLELLEGAKDEAKKKGLWNFFLPDAGTAYGPKTLDDACRAFELGKIRLASEVMNCAAPDTGNMEGLERFGTREQMTRWL